MDQLTSLLGIFSPQVNTKLTVPVTLKYNSADSTKNLTDYGKVYFDDVRVGVDTVLSKSVGPGLDLLDKVMSPMYFLEDALSKPIDLWPQSPITPALGPNDLSSWPDWVATPVKDVGNAPGDLVNSLVNKVRDTLDRDSDNQVSLFEGLRGTVDLYQELALSLSKFWNTFSSFPGAEKALNAALASATSGLVSSASSLFQAIADSVTKPKPTADNPDPKSPMEQIQYALDMTENVLNAVDQLQGLRTLYQQAMGELAGLAQANADTALSFSLGSYVWDVPNGSLTQINNSYAKKPVEYVYPPGYDQISESVTTKAEARKLIYQTVKAGKASKTTLSPGVFEKAGVDFTLIDVYKNIGFKGVDDSNFDAICDILNNKRGNTFTSGVDWSDYNNILESVDLAFVLDLDEVLHYQRLYRMTSGQGDFKGWEAKTMGDTFRTLGVASADESKYYDLYKYYGHPNRSNYKYGGKAASYTLYDIINAQPSFQSIDTFQEIKAIWLASKKIEDLGYNLSVDPKIRGYIFWITSGSDFSKASRDQFFLSFDEFNTIGLPILSRSEDVRKTANEMFRDWANSFTFETPKKFDDLFDEVQTYINDNNNKYLKDNGTAGSSLAKNVISKFIGLADVSNGGSGGSKDVSLDDFQTLGINTMSKDWLQLFSDLLATSQIKGQEVNSVSSVKKLVDAIKTFMDAVADQQVDATKFYQAISLMMGSDSAKKLEYIPRATTGGMEYTYSTEKVPLLQDIIAARDTQEVDTYSEVSKLFDITQDILLTSMSDKRIWETNVSYPKGRSEETDKTYGLDYKSRLSANDLHLLGYPNATTATAQALAQALKDHNVTGKKYWFKVENYNTIWATSSKIPELGTPLTLKVLGNLIDDSSQNGFLDELFSKAPITQKLWTALHSNGFDTPFLNDPALLQKLWKGEPVDFLTFTPDLSKLSYNSGPLTLFNTDLFSLAGAGNDYIKAPLTGSAEVSLVPRLSFGVDSGGFNELMGLQSEGKALTGADLFKGIAALLNGFYVRDSYYQGGTWVDLPELDMNFAFNTSLGLQLGTTTTMAEAFGKLSTALNLGVTADLASPDPYGKVRLANLIGDLFSNPLDIIDIESQLDLTLKAEAGATLRLPKESDGSLLGFLGAAASIITGTTDWKWGPVSSGQTYTLIDDNPNTDAPSLTDFVNKIASAVIPA